MKIFLAIIFYILVTVEGIFLPTDSRFGKEAYIRIESLPGSRRSVILAEEERLVQFLFDADDNILECRAEKRISHLLEHLMAEVARFEETGVMPSNVVYEEQTVDVGWYGRYCRKYLRDQLRDAELGDSRLDDKRLKDLLDSNWIEKGVEGTNFCTRRLPSHAYLDRNLGHATALDTCCMGLWSCHVPEVPHMPLTWQHNHLNSGHWPLWSCPCLQTFYKCLEDTSHPDKERLQSVFNQYGNKCFNVKEEYERYIRLSRIKETHE